MEKINKNRVLLFSVFILLFLCVMVIYNIRYSNNTEEIQQDIKKYNLLNDYSRFFTVNSCVYRYIVYLQNKDTDSLLKVLDKDYIETNSINENNVYNILGTLNGNYSFSSKKIYYEKINDQYIKYYVYGYLSLETIDEINKKEDKYYIVTLDVDNQLFSIMPYGGKIFQEEDNE